MKKIFLYSYLKCSTCRKASKWLDQENIQYELIDIVATPPRAEFLELALKQYFPDKKKIFNTRGKSFRLINLDIENLANDEIIPILLNDGKLIKRPFLVYKEEKVILGFKEFEYINHFY